MNNLERLWNERNKEASGKPIYDLWLDNYQDILQKSKEKIILDLGCGIGNDSLYLTERGYKLIACDISTEAINNVTRYIPSIQTKQMNLVERFPFKDKSVALIIADLSLHYFTKKDTLHIIREIKRILDDQGVLLARVHSTKNLEKESSKLEKIDDNLYLRNNEIRRFFDEKDINDYFSIIGDITYEEKKMKRGKIQKVVFEIKCIRSK